MAIARSGEKLGSAGWCCCCSRSHRRRSCFGCLRPTRVRSAAVVRARPGRGSPCARGQGWCFAMGMGLRRMICSVLLTSGEHALHRLIPSGSLPSRLGRLRLACCCPILRGPSRGAPSGRGMHRHAPSPPWRCRPPARGVRRVAGGCR